MSEFKPCPLCGYEYIGIDMVEGIDHDEYRIFCRNCHWSTRVHFSERGAKKEWDAPPRHLKWSKNKPTSGWFFLHRKDSDMEIVFVENDRVKAGSYSIPVTVSLFNDAEWAGPIPLPLKGDTR